MVLIFKVTGPTLPSRSMSTPLKVSNITAMLDNQFSSLFFNPWKKPELYAHRQSNLFLTTLG